MELQNVYVNAKERQRYGLAIMAFVCFKMHYVLIPSFSPSSNGQGLLSTQMLNSAESSLSISLNNHVSNWITYYKKDHNGFAELYRRGSIYRPIVEKILADHQIPKELYYLPMIESRYDKNAKSRGKAVGVWQFTTLTAKHYGLKVDHRIDERKHILSSTKAAAQYLKDLYKQFNSWELALAAYNCGPTCVQKSLKKGKTNNYWILVDKKLLPKETRNYVAKFMAVTYLGEGNRL